MKSNSHSILRNLWLLAGWILVGLVIWLSLIPSPPQIMVMDDDKVNHLAAYFTLMVWFGLIARENGFHARLAIALTALGVMLEFLQKVSGYRTFELYDMLANSAGVLAGWFLIKMRIKIEKPLNAATS